MKRTPSSLRRWFRALPRYRRGLASSPNQSGSYAVDESLGRELLGLDGGLGLFRLVHLLDAFARCDRPRTVLSVGSGGGLHEAYLAHKYPQISVCGVDLRAPYAPAVLPNARFLEGDLLDPGFAAQLPPADFVYSIECLEHIQEDRKVFSRMAELVLPGGLLYLEVPFASEAEQADPEVCDRERTNHEHVRPGYSADQLEALAKENGLTEIDVNGAFWFPVQPMVWLAHLHLGFAAISPFWMTFLAIAELDLRKGKPSSRAESTAIKLLARRPL